jgi:hypothetical protein
VLATQAGFAFGLADAGEEEVLLMTMILRLEDKLLAANRVLGRSVPVPGSVRKSRTSNYEIK